MQRTPGSAEPPQANESPPSNAPSPLNPPPNGILGNPMDQPMPTLSPNPPPRSSSDSLGGIGSIASFRAELNGIIDLAKSDPSPKQPLVGELSVPKEEEEEDVWSCFELPSVEGDGNSKRPRLPSMPHSQEDLQDGNLENLYEHDNSGERFSQPHKRLRQERRTRSCLDSNVFSLQNDVDTLQRVKTPDFDPYEFMDTSPTEVDLVPPGARAKMARGSREVCNKEETVLKKERNSSEFVITIDNPICKEEEAQRKAEGEKARQEAMTPMNVSYPNEPFKMGDFGVPLLPRPESSSLTTEKDLQITLNDFESLFESSDEDDDRVPLTNVSSDFPCGANSEENLSTRTLFGSSISSSSMSGPLTGGDLGRMYPTPPSEEQTHFSPVNHPCPELSSNLTSYGSNQTRDMTSGPMNEQFEIEIEESLCSPRPEPLLDWTYVYKVPAVEKIVGATMYAP
ncbi:putative mediator of RNA polymerase II transcription subunit 13-like [Apostichopus japonicus]|uniref:Putative mediator of RNA polymerase II transcription subunit 13-like n=1 Tax=Stichopus japonicus TaxID=307972 RepID=A0A2G8KL10_STIJA|nr:putative mediator of RNA polymerase II transcription subunit 13-like [Apostichopus japonicus]